MLKRTGFVLVCLAVFSAVTCGLAFSKSLMVVPQSLNLTIASGRLDTCRLRVVNLTKSILSVKADFNSQWISITPSEFKIPPNETKEVLGIFFILRDENPRRKEEIVFRTKDEKEEARVKVAVLAPPEEILPTQEEQIELLKKEVEAYKNKTEELKKEVEILHQKIREEEIRYGGELKKSKESEEIKSLFELLTRELGDEIQSDKILLALKTGNLIITIPGLFNSAQTYPQEQGLLILDKIGTVFLREKLSDKRITVRGYTDALPVGEKLKDRFLSNWELSSARAAGIVRILKERIGQDNYFFSTGCASYNFLTDNKTIENRAKNRRVEIIVSVPDE